jgi:hypothetical protein
MVDEPGVQGLVIKSDRAFTGGTTLPRSIRICWKTAYRFRGATLCLGAVLVRHGLSDAILDRLDMAMLRGSRVPALRPIVGIHVVAKKTFDLATHWNVFPTV